MSNQNVVSNWGGEFEFLLRKGIYAPIAFYIDDTELEPAVLTGYSTAKLTIRASESETATVLVTKTGAISAPSASNLDQTKTEYWQILFEILGSQTNAAAFDDLEGFLMAKMNDPSGNPVEIGFGPVTFRPQVDQQ